MYVRFVQISDFAVRIVPRPRTVKRERHRPVSEYREFAVEQRKCGALFDPGRQNTDALQTVARTQPNVVRARAASSDAQTGSAPHATIVSRAPSNRTLYYFVIEQLGPPTALNSTKPGGNCLDNPVASHRWRKETAIEEHRIGSNHSLVGRRTVHGDSRLREKFGKILGDGRNTCA